MTDLAEHLDTTNTHLGRVRDEYHRTKADHAHEDGCNSCTVAFVEGRSTGWEYEPDGTPAFCPPCAAERNRWSAQMAAAVEGKGRCSNDLHDMTDAANHYRTTNGRGGTVLRCRECYRVMNKARKVRERQAAKAAL